jgi:hypothetical protein
MQAHDSDARMAKRAASRRRTTTDTATSERLAFDAHLMDVYVTGLQAEVEAKLRRVAKFREHMAKIAAAGGDIDVRARRRAAEALLRQVDEMLDTNVLVRGTLEELRSVAQAVLVELDEIDQDQND